MPSFPAVKPHFGAIFAKKPIVVDLQSENEDVVTVANHVDGTVYSIPTDEFVSSYERTPGSKTQYRSRPGHWKDLKLVLPGTTYRGRDGAEKTAVSGILVREKDNTDTYYEISPYYAIGAFTPAKNDAASEEMLTQILNRAHLQGPIDDLQAMNNYAFKLLFINRPYIMSLSGYSDAPDRYSQRAQTVLTEIIRSLGDGKIGFITSPTAITNSIDAVGTILSQKYAIPIIYVTAEDFLQYIEPSKFPAEIERKLYGFTEKFFFKKPSDYSQATAWASNVCVVMGGREAAVRDAVNALKRGNKVIVIEDEGSPNPAVVDASKRTRSSWNTNDDLVDNASRYLSEQLQSFQHSGSLKHESRGGLTAEFLESLSAEQPLDTQIKVIRIGKDEEKAVSSLKRQLKHLDAFLDGPDLPQDD